MVTIIDELWIITIDGIVLFSHTFKHAIDPQLFGALLSAINSFSEEVADEGLSDFQFGERQFLLFKKRDLLFLGSSHDIKKKNIINKELESIARKFFEKYPLKGRKDDWNKEVSVYKDFGKEIEDAFQDSIQAFWKGF
ncbi:MAG: hypothetical protein BAJALOKI1v1_1100005 [Promethearchaeota archaeon]|nr:MAG: hypothetical protein BAJALOKI1v1_1100005 [Candidatus Lokiarchaeota archaeon]